MNKNISRVMEVLLKHYASRRRTTLNRMRKKPDPFKILISCLISLRTKDEITEKVSKELFKIADSPEKLSKMPLEKIEKIVFSTGHYRKKARAVRDVSQELLERFGGRVPRTREGLLSIKGVGPKTANIVLNFAFGKEVIPVDVNVHRVVNRLGWVKTKTPEETEKELEKVLPRKYWKEINGIMMLFGKEFCLPRGARCGECPVRKWCLKPETITVFEK